MLYSYIAHPYPPPPPSSSPPDSSSRKRAAPDEPQTSRSKRKRSNARDAVESKSECCAGVLGLIHVAANGSRRGYNANKRSQAAQIAAQNGMQLLGLRGIVLFTISAQRNYKHIRLEVRIQTIAGPQLQVGAQSDSVVIVSNLDHAGAARPGTENSAGSGGTDGTGPLHPELQFARCMSNRYKTESFPRCVSCTRRWAGDTCRFQGIRFFLKDEKQNIVGVSFVENQKADSPSMKFPTRWNRPLDTVFIKEIKVRIALVSHTQM
jgi:lysine-specific demethylase 3